MGITKNLNRSEGIVRIILGAFLVIWGLFQSGLWKPLSLIVGALLILTAFVGY